MRVFRGRWGRRAWRRRAAAMFVTPARRRTVMARLRRLAMTRGLVPVGTWLWFSSKVTSRTQCSVFSTCQWPRTVSPRSAGLAWWAASEVTVSAVWVRHVPVRVRRRRTTWTAWAAWGKPIPARTETTFTVRVSARRARGRGPGPLPAPASRAGLCAGRAGSAGCPSRSTRSARRGVKGGGGGLLGVRGIGGDDRAGQLQGVEQGGQPGRLAGLRAHVHLAEHHTVVVVDRGQQVAGRIRPTGAAPGLAVDCDVPAPLAGRCRALLRPRPEQGVEGVGVKLLE